MLSRAQAAVCIPFYGIRTESATLITTYSLLGSTPDILGSTSNIWGR